MTQSRTNDKSARAQQRAAQRLGRIGENLCLSALKARGWQILERNYRCPWGEIDILAKAPAQRYQPWPSIVCVEVKTRRAHSRLGPECSVSLRKRQKLHKSLLCWCENQRLRDKDFEKEKLCYRFDIAAIVYARGRAPRLQYFVSAF